MAPGGVRRAPAAARRSGGLLLYRQGAGGIEVFLVHPGGPFFRRRDDGVWSLPKGEVEAGEQPYDVACREFAEETGQTLEACGATGEPIPLGEVRQRGGKVVEAWALAGDWPAGAELRSNCFTLEWPPHSGNAREFPEVDRGGFFTLPEARRKLNPAQAPFLDRLLEQLGAAGA